VALVECAHRCRAETKPEQPVERGGRTSAQQVAQHDRASLLAGEPLQFGGHLLADAAQPLGLADDLAHHRHAAAHPASTFGDHDDGELRSVQFAVANGLGHRLQLVGDLGDQDRVGTACHTRVERDPTRVAAHHLDDDDPPVRRGRGEQPIDALRSEADRGVETEGGIGALEIVVDGLGHADHPQAGLGQMMPDG